MEGSAVSSACTRTNHAHRTAVIRTLDSSSQSPESPSPIPARSRSRYPVPVAFHRQRPAQPNAPPGSAKYAHEQTAPPCRHPEQPPELRAITPSARSPTWSTVSPPTISFFQTDHPVSVPESPSWSSPHKPHSPTPSTPRRPFATSPNPAIAQVSRARCIGLTKTASNFVPFK